MAESETEEQPALVCWFLPETEGRAVEDIINHFGHRAEPSMQVKIPAADIMLDI